MVGRMNDRKRVWSEERMDGRREGWMAGGKERRRRDGRKERMVGGKINRKDKDRRRKDVRRKEMVVV
jgi:hypothetical protein